MSQIEKIEKSVKGKQILFDGLRFDNTEIIVTGKVLRTARLKEEWDDVVENPERLINEIKKSRLRADLFTFIGRFLEKKSNYDYHMELDNAAELPITSYEHWWKKQINDKTRNMVRKAGKNDLQLKVVDFDDDLVKGIENIYNESPIRQGKPFWHYGKSFDEIKRENSTYLDRSHFIGAYYNGELIGFIKMVCKGNYASIMQIISLIKYRDKAPTNALLAKAVEVCEYNNISCLAYDKYSYGKIQKDTLSNFKEHNGFKKFVFPRYYIPLTVLGHISLNLNIHHGILNSLPRSLMLILKDIREKYYIYHQSS